MDLRIVARPRDAVPVGLGPDLALSLSLAQHLPTSFRPTSPLFRLGRPCYRAPAQLLLAQFLLCGSSPSSGAPSFAAPLPPHVRVDHECTAGVADVLVAAVA